MRTRCFNPKSPSYPRYGARGITVCERWLNSFAAFLADVGPRPPGEYSLDRIDNDGNYEPGNVHWATDMEQAHNRSNNSLVTFDGKTQCMSEWAREKGLSKKTLRRRLEQWGIERALNTPRRRYKTG